MQKNAMRSYYKNGKKAIDRVVVVASFLCLFAVAIIARLVVLQIVQNSTYQALAEGQQVVTTTDPATRGKIYIQGDLTGAPTVLATNVPLDLLYVDPNPYNTKEMDSLIDTDFVAELISPVLFSHFCEVKVYQTDTTKTCAEKVAEFTKLPLEKEETTKDKKGTESSVKLEKTDDDLKKDIQTVLAARLREKEVVFVPLLYTNDPVVLEKIKSTYTLPGIYVGEGIVYGNPVEVSRNSDQKLTQNYEELGKELNLNIDALNTKLSRRISRYTGIVRRMHPDLSKKIKEWKEFELKCPQLKTKPAKESLDLINSPICAHIKKTAAGKAVRNLFGIALQEENWRYYPEDTLASQVVGFLNFEKNGSYGIEEEYDNLLRGNDGELKFTSDPMGRLIASNLKADLIRPKEDGVDIYLTINRVVQKHVEDDLEAKVKAVRANSGQAIVMDPFTGKIIALAQYPKFNPNLYSDAYAMERTTGDPGQGIPLFVKDERGNLQNVNEWDRGKIPYNVDRFVYKNKVGPGAFYNHSVQGVYEPGSIFKPLIIASGMDAGEITPQTMYHDRGELKVDEFTIKNVSGNCTGYHNMINVLNWSCNIGMSFVARTMGKALMYDYITKFGMGTRTDIELPDEAKGKVYPYQEWSDARLYNAAFGQGLTVTPLQMAQAYSALANGGILVSPRVVDKIVYPDGKNIVTEKQIVKRVISKETADTITAMLTSVAEVGGSKPAKVPGYYIAGKTGTAQIASSRGGYEEGIGSTTGSFSGWIPADKPKFVIITKIDRPRTSPWADQSAAPLFKEIATFLMDYYNVAPERAK